MDDWQDRAFSQKRLPHRSKGGVVSVFDVRKAFGAYSITSKAIDRAGQAATVFRAFEMHGRDETGEAIVASFSGTGTTTGVALLAGNRKLLQRLVAECDAAAAAAAAESDEDEGKGTAEGKVEDAHDASDADSSRSSSSSHSDADSDTDLENGVEVADRKENARYRAFEKNSFRRPKFWMQWKAAVQRPEDGRTVVETNFAYLVFPRNDCKTFTGTLTSEVLGWKDVAIAGRKMSAKARECPLSWTEVKVTDAARELQVGATDAGPVSSDAHEDLLVDGAID